MAYLIALGILSLLGIVSTVWLIRTDGYGRIPVDPRRLPGGVERTAPRAAPEPPAAQTAATPVARRQRRAARA